MGHDNQVVPEKDTLDLRWRTNSDDPDRMGREPTRAMIHGNLQPRSYRRGEARLVSSGGSLNGRLRPADYVRA
jgi:hypothetical protein